MVPGSSVKQQPSLAWGFSLAGTGDRSFARSLAPRLCGKISKDSRCVNKRIAAAFVALLLPLDII